jgi:hypothetical protein
MNQTTPQEITFAEIRKGDKLRVTDTYPSGSQIVIIGIAEQPDMSSTEYARWLTNGSHGDATLVIGVKNPEDGVKQKIELLERERVPTPRVAGTIIRIKEFKDYGDLIKQTDSLAILDNDHEWCMWEYPVDVGCKYIAPEDVLDWNPVNITDLPHSR